MAAIRRILCPIDFSRYSRHALEQAVALGRLFGAEVTALHVHATAPVFEMVPTGARAAIEASDSVRVDHAGSATGTGGATRRSASCLTAAVRAQRMTATPGETIAQ